jgi:AcrR family transcriptional regulator
MRARDAHKEQTKQRILDVALAMFRGKGFRQTTMRDIAEAAGIALGTTYNYFSTKDHIALFFFEEALGRVLARHRRETAPEASLEERVFSLVALELEEVEPFREFLDVLVAQAAVPGSPLHPFGLDAERLKSRYLDHVAGMLREALDRGELPPGGFESLILQAFWAFHLGILFFWLNDESPHKEDTWVVLDKSLRFILGALRQGGQIAPEREERAG